VSGAGANTGPVSKPETGADGDKDKDAKESRILWRVLEEVDVDGRVSEVVEVNLKKAAKEDAETFAAAPQPEHASGMEVDPSASLAPQAASSLVAKDGSSLMMAMEGAPVVDPSLDVPLVYVAVPHIEGDLAAYIDAAANIYPPKMVKKLKVEVLCTQHIPVRCPSLFRSS
jgi:hypothetical protein